LHFHGGGYVLGRAIHSDARNEAIARNCGVAVVSVDYRRAPEDPYPAGPDDCEAAALWLVEHAKAEFGSERLVIGGESAGATFSAVTLVRLRDRHGLRPFAAANLLYGNYDLFGTPSLELYGDRRLVTDRPVSHWFHDTYVPRERQREPDVSPLYADLDRLPPALFSIGTDDPLRDDTLFMYLRWLAAGNLAELAVYPGGPHMFDAFDLKIAHDAQARIDRFIAEAVSQQRRAAGE
jgi:acetyl esterase/lipase